MPKTKKTPTLLFLLVMLSLSITIFAWGNETHAKAPDELSLSAPITAIKPNVAFASTASSSFVCDAERQSRISREYLEVYLGLGGMHFYIIPRQKQPFPEASSYLEPILEQYYTEEELDYEKYSDRYRFYQVMENLVDIVPSEGSQIYPYLNYLRADVFNEVKFKEYSTCIIGDDCSNDAYLLEYYMAKYYHGNFGLAQVGPDGDGGFVDQWLDDNNHNAEDLFNDEINLRAIDAYIAGYWHDGDYIYEGSVVDAVYPLLSQEDRQCIHDNGKNPRICEDIWTDPRDIFLIAATRYGVGPDSLNYEGLPENIDKDKYWGADDHAHRIVALTARHAGCSGYADEFGDDWGKLADWLVHDTDEWILEPEYDIDGDGDPDDPDSFDVNDTDEYYEDIRLDNQFLEYIYSLKKPRVLGYTYDGDISTNPRPVPIPKYFPENNITRGEMAKIIKNAADYWDYLECEIPVFSDIIDSAGNKHTFYNEIRTLQCNEVIDGYSDGTFRPDENLTRQEMAKFVKNGFTKVNHNTWIPRNGHKSCEPFPHILEHIDGLINPFYEHIHILKCNDILHGYSDGTFLPHNPVTRAEAAKFVAGLKFPTIVKQLKILSSVNRSRSFRIGGAVTVQNLNLRNTSENDITRGFGSSSEFWLAPVAGGITSYNATTDVTTVYTTTHGLPNNLVTTLAINPINGNVWAGTPSGLSLFNGTSWNVPSELPSALLNEPIFAIAITDAGLVWVSSSVGLYQYDGTTWTSYSSGQLPAEQPQTLITDQNDLLWGTTANGDFGNFDGSTWQSVSTISDTVTDMAVISDTIYIGTNHGLLSYQNGQLSRIDGDTSITTLSADSFGKLWVMNSNRDIAIYQGSVWLVPFSKGLPYPHTITHICCTEPLNDDWYADDVSITLSAYDDLSGVANTQYRLSDGHEWQIYTDNTTITFTQEGRWTLQTFSVDNIGHIEKQQNHNIFIDKTPPTSTLTITPTAINTFGQYTTNITVTIRAGDNGLNSSGIKSIQYRLNNGPWENYWKPLLVESNGDNLLEYYVSDVAGNESPVEEVVISITKPNQITFIPLDAQQNNHRRAYDQVFRAMDRGEYPLLLDSPLALYGETYSAGTIVLDGVVTGNFTSYVVTATNTIEDAHVLSPSNVALFSSSSNEGRASWEEVDFQRLFNDYLWQGYLTPVNETDIADGLYDIDILVLPAGISEDVIARLSDAGAFQAMETFVQNGGWIYAQGDATLLPELAGLLPAGTVGDGLNMTGTSALSVDNPHSPLTYNWLQETVTVFKDSPLFTPSGNTNIVANYTNSGNPAILTRRVGDGGVILMGPHPTQDSNTYPLILNAIFLAQSERVHVEAEVESLYPGVIHNTIPAYETGIPVQIRESATVYGQPITNFQQRIVVDPAFALIGNPVASVGVVATQIVSGGLEILWTASTLPLGEHTLIYQVETTNPDTLRDGTYEVSTAAITYEDGGQTKQTERDAAVIIAAEPPIPVHIADSSPNNYYPFPAEGIYQHESHTIGNKLSTALHNGIITITVPLIVPGMDAFDQTTFATDANSGDTLWFLNSYSGYPNRSGSYPTTATSPFWEYDINAWHCNTWVRIPNPQNQPVTIPPEFADFIMQEPGNGDILVAARTLTFDVGSLLAYNTKSPAVRYRVHSKEIFGRAISVSSQPATGTLVANGNGFSVYTRIGQHPIPFREFISSGAINNPVAPIQSKLTFNDIWGRTQLVTDTVTSGFYDVVPVGMGPGDGDHHVDFGLTTGIQNTHGEFLTDFPIYEPVTVTAILKVKSYNFDLDDNEAVLQYWMPRGFHADIEYVRWESDNPTVVLQDSSLTDVPAFLLHTFQGVFSADAPTTITVTTRMTALPSAYEGHYLVNGGGGIAALDQLASESQYDMYVTNPHVEIGYQANIEAKEMIAPIGISVHGGLTHDVLTVEDPDEPRLVTDEVLLDATLAGLQTAQATTGMAWGPDIFDARVYPSDDTISCLEISNNSGINWESVTITPQPAAGLTLTPLFNGIETPPNIYNAPYMWANDIRDIGRGIYCWQVTVSEDVLGGMLYPIKFTLDGVNVPASDLFPMPTAYVGVKDESGRVYRVLGQAQLNQTITQTVPLYATPLFAMQVTADEEQAFIDILNASGEDAALAYLQTLSTTLPITVTTLPSATEKIVTVGLPPELSALPYHDGNTWITDFRIITPLALDTLPNGTQPASYGFHIGYTDDFDTTMVATTLGGNLIAHGPEIEGSYSTISITNSFDNDWYIYLSPNEENIVDILVSFGNGGDYPAITPTVTITIADDVELLNADPMWSEHNGQQYSWDYVSILPVDRETIALTVSITPTAGTVHPLTPMPIGYAPLLTGSWADYVDGYANVDVSESVGGIYQLPVGEPGMAPVNLQATLVRDNTALLTWTEVPGATGYRIYHSRAGDPDYFTNFIEADHSGTEYVGVTSNREHRFVVVALGTGSTEGRPSNVATLYYTWDMLPDLGVNLTATPTNIVAGEPVTFTATIVSDGIIDATNNKFTLTLPDGFSYVSDDFGCTAVTPQTITCTQDLMPTGTSQTIHITAVTEPSILGVETVQSEIYSLDFTDPYPSDNAQQLSLEVTASNDLSLSIQTPQTVTAGLPFSYTINLTAEGPSVGWNNKVTITLPAEVTFVSSSNCSAANSGIVTCTVDTLQPDETTTLSLNVELTSIAQGALTTTAIAASDISADPDDSNNEKTIVTPIHTEGDLQIVHSLPDTIVAGMPFTVSYSILNDGPSMSRDLFMSNTLPSGISLASTSLLSCSEVGCDISDLDAGETVGFDLVFETASHLLGEQSSYTGINGSTYDHIAHNNVHSQTFQIVDMVDLSLTLVGNPEPVIAGTILTYTLTAHNNGPSLARSPIITLTLPTGQTYLENNQLCSDNGETVVCSLSDLPPQNDEGIQLAVMVSPDVVGEFVTNAIIDSTATEVLPEDNDVNTTITAVAQGHLGIVLYTSPDPVVAGTPLTHTFTVQNYGSSVAWNTVVTLTLPTAFENIVTMSDGCITVDNVTIVCSLGDIEVDDTNQLLLVGVVDPTIVGSITSEAIVDSDADDPNLDDNRSSNTITVIGQADLGVKQTATLPSLPHTTITHTVAITNLGPSNANGASLMYLLPAHTTYLSSSGTCAVAEQTATCVLGTLPPDAVAYIDIVLSVEEGFSGDLESVASVNSSTADVNLANNTHRLNTPIGMQIYLPVVMSPSMPDLPDLVVKSISVTTGSVSLVIANEGGTSLLEEDGFWVDLYINPDPVPTQVNEIWHEDGRSVYGAVWSVTHPLAPGEELSLTLYDDYYSPVRSHMPSSIPSGTRVYVQVDSFNLGSIYGNVQESHERHGYFYNNVMGIVVD